MGLALWLGIGVTATAGNDLPSNTLTSKTGVGLTSKTGANLTSKVS